MGPSCHCPLEVTLYAASTTPLECERVHASAEGADMALITALLASLRRDEGQGLAEYALILALIAIVAIVALIFLGGQVSTIISTVGNSV